MIQYYRVPVKKGAISKQQFLHINDDADLKDALFSKSIEKVKVLSFKNANIKDDTLRLLWDITTVLPVVQLDLSQNFSFITDNAIEIIVELVCFKNLKILNLADNQVTDDSMVLLSRSMNMHHLQQLILYGNSNITGAGLLLIAQSNSLKHLKHLDLHDTSVDDEGMHEFMKSQNCQSLEKLNLSMSYKQITNKTLYAIANSAYCKNIKEFILEDCKITDQGIDVLSQSDNISHLEYLNLNNNIKQTNNIITDKSLVSMSLSKHMVNIKKLELRNTDITAKGIRTLAVSMASQSLEIVRLSHCKGLDDEVLTYIEKIQHYQSLKKVYLNDCKIDKQYLENFEKKNPSINLIY